VSEGRPPFKGYVDGVVSSILGSSCRPFGKVSSRADDPANEAILQLPACSDTYSTVSRITSFGGVLCLTCRPLSSGTQVDTVPTVSTKIPGDSDGSHPHPSISLPCVVSSLFSLALKIRRRREM
jgi:hypothetical protein